MIRGFRNAWDKDISKILERIRIIAPKKIAKTESSRIRSTKNMGGKAGYALLSSKLWAAETPLIVKDG
jgi:hypothetical protein